MRDSTTLSAGLSKLCLETGFDDLDDADFQLQAGLGAARCLERQPLWHRASCFPALAVAAYLKRYFRPSSSPASLVQDGNKVREMAFLFKMESDAKAASSPKGGAEAGSPKPQVGDAPSDPAAAAASRSSIKERVQRLQTAAAAGPQSRQDAGAKAPRAPRPAPAAKPPAARAGLVAARPSRLRPPSTSSSYFNHGSESRCVRCCRIREDGRSASPAPVVYSLVGALNMPTQPSAARAGRAQQQQCRRER